MSQAVNLQSPLSDPQALPLVKIETLIAKNGNFSNFEHFSARLTSKDAPLSPVNPLKKDFDSSSHQNWEAREAKTALIVAPHPDDETLGCGGAIALLRRWNLPVEVLIVSDGTKSHPNSLKYPPPALKNLRERESLAALAILGVKSEMVTFFGLPDGAIDLSSQCETAIELCRNYLTRIAPSLIFLPWRNDPHEDHRASWELLQVTCRSLSPSPRMIEYPIWDWDTQQRQNFSESVNAWRLDISSVLDLKKQAIERYRSQISDLIDDDPQAFRLTPEMLQNFTQPWEIYLEVN